jgi:deoxyribose-phosphate aldolase
MDEVLSRIEATNLSADATEHDIRYLCNQAEVRGFAGVCVPPMHVRLASTLLEATTVVENRRQQLHPVATVVGFPLGNTDSMVKEYEAKAALSWGADELDMVLNRSLLKQGRIQEVIDDINRVVGAQGNSAFGATKPAKHATKVIVEISDLDFAELELAVECIILAGADYVKTSTGYGSCGVQTGDVNKLAILTAGTNLKIKASAGIDKYWTAKELVGLGADRLGVSKYGDLLLDRERCLNYEGKGGV